MMSFTLNNQSFLNVKGNFSYLKSLLSLYMHSAVATNGRDHTVTFPW